MSKRIRAGIVGYGNLGKGVEKAMDQNPDFHLKYIFTRRPVDQVQVQSNIQVVGMSSLDMYQDKIDMMFMCGGSATDLPKQVPNTAKYFNTVDAYDNHARIPHYYSEVDKMARCGDKLSMISTGWDPGFYSMVRVIMESGIPIGKNYTIPGIGVSQGHSDAIRRIKGVADGKQYTIPIEESLSDVCAGSCKTYTPGELVRRHCYVVAEEGEDKYEIERQIVNMPDYFAPYTTTVEFLSKADFDRDHTGLPHAGWIMRNGVTAEKHKQLMHLHVKLDSNPEFSAGFMVAFARAAWRLYKDGHRGAVTPFDVPVSYLSQKSREELLRKVL